jgi:hypothetical protein
MRTIEVVIAPGHFSERLNEMREWLDEQGIEPSRFNYDSAQRSVVMRVDFKVAEEAQAFTRRFVGRAATRPGNSDESDRHGEPGCRARATDRMARSHVSNE